ncbi:hypothetical protein [Cupriavidus sp. AcVe19-1a]|uniref:hypothetical protein n=1 Tax=Cupriavidus sp. AcVe19-1a TaxID=2821359 RepID=UPI001FD77173|nr:hypothetical protein [Cupriavidus sp. AcVe19-1a]
MAMEGNGDVDCSVAKPLCAYMALNVRCERHVLAPADFLRRRDRRPADDLNYIALVFVAAVLACIAILPDMRMSLLVSVVWVGIVYVAYRFYTREDKAALRNLASNP